MFFYKYNAGKNFLAFFSVRKLVFNILCWVMHVTATGKEKLAWWKRKTPFIIFPYILVWVIGHRLQFIFFHLVSWSLTAKTVDKTFNFCLNNLTKNIFIGLKLLVYFKYFCVNLICKKFYCHQVKFLLIKNLL